MKIIFSFNREITTLLLWALVQDVKTFNWKFLQIYALVSLIWLYMISTHTLEYLMNWRQRRRWFSKRDEILTRRVTAVLIRSRKALSSCIVRSFLSISRSFFFFTLLQGFRLAGIPAAVRSGPQTTSSIVGRARAPVITLREGEYGYRGPGLKPRVSPIAAAAAAVFLRFIIQPSVFQTPANARTVTPMLRVVSRRFVGTRGPPRPRRGPNATPTLRGVTSERGEI